MGSSAERELADLTPATRQRVLARIRGLAESPRPASAERLTGTLHGSLRLRVGDYRISYEIDDQTRTVVVWAIGHRSRFYGDAGRRRH